VVRVEYACLDGSPFPVVFGDASDVALRWLIDREHAPNAMTPLADAVRGAGRRGADTAYAESGLAMPSSLRREPPRANGFDYFVDPWLGGDERDEFRSGVARLAEQYGGTLGVWLHHSLPRVRDACAWLGAAPPETSFGALAERRAYAWSHTGVAGVVARRDLDAVVASCEAVCGDRAILVAHDLAQGSDNETIAADAALWRLSCLEPGSREARTAREQYFATYGSRTTSWSIDHPTLLERPELVDAQIRLLRQHGRHVGDVRPGAAARRRQRAHEIKAGLRSGEERDRFDRRLARLESFVPVREARARWQLVASGALRHAVRERGRLLAESHVIDQTDDVFFLTPDEFDDPTGDLRTAVVARRAEHARGRAVIPPVAVGRTEPEPELEAGPGPPGRRRAGAGDGVLRGAPGAPGVARGSARVILELDHAEQLAPGDVLVTTMTSPAWTPLFGIAGAVVTDAGDAVSHVAIAAREYGIPCVVGTHHATVLVPDGAHLTVDGDAGIVRVHGQPTRRAGAVVTST
jgi:phosphohistidine swiveling domain-containing protein